MMKRVLVTGASGFVGRALVPALSRSGWNVRAALREGTPAPPFGAIEIVRHPSLATSVDWTTALRDVDAVVHLAGIAHTNGVTEDLFDRVNHRATADLARAAHAAGVKRFVFVSSIKAQTGASTERIVTEADRPDPVDGYGRSKLAAERAVAGSGVAFTILRPVLVYGPGAKGNLRTLARITDSPWPLPLGGLTNRRSMVAVENLIAAIELGLEDERAAGQTFAVADPRAVTLPEIITALRRGQGRSARLVTVPQGAIRLMLTALRRDGVWDRIGGSLEVDPAKLLGAGWKPPIDTIAGLTALARAAS